MCCKNAHVSTIINFTLKLAVIFSFKVQYVALGPRVKVIILNILPELKPDGLKFSLKIDLMSLTIIAK